MLRQADMQSLQATSVAEEACRTSTETRDSTGHMATRRDTSRVHVVMITDTKDADGMKAIGEATIVIGRRENEITMVTMVGLEAEAVAVDMMTTVRPSGSKAEA